ncbi:carbohydrate kinase family protein [Cryptosporangium sp. NPDC051539]|uniref:carbohydrate kinase family protein n=1 Tax=Cryptosporangium sp. NPDC051539 TaxID=3363962 RepID=UPI0037A9B754
MNGFAFDVIGVGALNLDHRISGLTTATLAALLGRPIEWGTETPVDAATVETVLRRFPARATPGGSAYNAIATVAAEAPGLRLGYVGVGGRTFDHFDGVDHRHVLRADAALSGTCIAYTESGERTLLTHAGANTLMAEHLRQSFEPIVSYLASARFVHVTSFLDPRTPPRLAELLRAVRARGTGTRISFDPGHTWATTGPPVLGTIRAAADYLFVNEVEFRALGARRHDGATIVLKRPDGIRMYGPDGFRHMAQTPLPEDAIRDATGAGDAFAGGFLAALSSAPEETPATGSAQDSAAVRGLAAARRRLLAAGPDTAPERPPGSRIVRPRGPRPGGHQ